MSTISASTTSTTAFKITTDTTGALVFQTGASPTTAMTLGSDQSVTFAGTPTYSGGTANGVAYLNGSKALTTGSALTFDGSQLDIPAGSASAPALSTPADPNTGLYFPAADTVSISTGGTDRLRVDASGNVGIGVTPSTWSGFTGLDMRGGLSFVSWNSYSTGGTYQNVYYDGAFRYKSSTFASRFLANEGNVGGFQWQIAPSGTAGNAITFTQAMTLEAAGNLLLGGTDTSIRSGIFGIGIGNASSASAGTALKTDGRNWLTFTSSSSTYSNGYIFYDVTAGAERARIDTSGRLTVPNTPMFSAVANGNGLGGSPANGTVMPFPTVLTNVGSSYNSSTYRFTAPIAGTYFFSASISPGNVSASNQWVALRPRKNGSIIAADVYSLGSVATFGNNSYATCAVSFTLTLAANDYVDCMFEYNTFNGNVNYGLFTGFLVG